MTTAKKVWLIVAALLVLAGSIMFVGVMTVLDWDFSKLGTNPYETNLHAITEDFQDISIRTNTATITFLPSPDGKCTVECYEREKALHAVTVEDGTLVIKVQDTRAWYEYIGINVGFPKITVYLPESQYASLFVKASTGSIKIPQDFTFTTADLTVTTGSVNFNASASEEIKIKTTTGNIRVENTSAGALNLSASTGAITLSKVSCEGDADLRVTTGKTMLTDVSCRNLISTGSTGDIALTNVIADEKITIERSTGDIVFIGCDASEIYAEASTGDITGSLLTEKVFFAQSDTGRINVPKTITGGRCELATDTGNIKIEIVP